MTMTFHDNNISWQQYFMTITFHENDMKMTFHVIR